MGYLVYLLLLICGFPLIHFTHGWTYHHSPNIMSYNGAQKYCKEKYTDMVAIQNQEENKYLNENLPFNAAYYWIGIRKHNGNWTWVGTKKVLTKEAENWAQNEPNNKNENENEDCVEMYVKRQFDTGKWNDEPCSKKKVALCYKASCHSSSCNNHGECMETIKNYTCSCSDGFYGKDCEHVVTCPKISRMDNGSVVCSHVNGDFTYQSSCNFTCSDGHLLVGSENLQCNGEGEWGSQIPHCKAIQCKQPELPDNGEMNCSSDGEILLENSTCTFSCKEGFTMVGASSVQCTTPGQWSEELPKCEAVQCDLPAAPDNGAMDCSSNRELLPYNTTCNIICNEGYTLVGDPSVRCMSHDKWSAEPPTCEAIQCDHPAVPDNGAMDCSSNTEMLPYNATCNIICNEGYTLVGDPSIRCMSPDKWSAEPPKCEAIQCDHPAVPDNGAMDCSSNTEMLPYNATCNIICNEGYTLVGDPSINCMSPNEWSAEIPTCEAIQCERPEQPENGSMSCFYSEGVSLYNSICNFSCDKGFALVGSPSIQCATTGQWTENPPKCEAVQCNALIAPSMGKVNCSDIDVRYGTICKFTCEYDLLLNGTDTLECDSNGRWNTEVPTCEAVNVAPETATYITVGIVSSGASVLSTASLIIWLLKRMRKTAKKFTPANSCQNLEATGVYQNMEDSWENV
ncbi:E-selectin-like [Eleutherodactylus coqui]|uniref:E-selectin-like n=1 Tax=Eleutherodactylus coqui TaxID=57060 RepID=UPI0034638288